MRHHLVTVALPLALAACVTPRASAPPPVAPALPATPPPPPPRTTDWRDIPLTVGDWRYAPAPSGGVAHFGRAGAEPELTVRCDLATRAITLTRTMPIPDTTPAATGTATGIMAITTSAGDRALPVVRVVGPPAGSAASLPARDGFLDRMAFSRGRFIVAVTGTARLVVPAWPEFARVIEDCRG